MNRHQRWINFCLKLSHKSKFQQHKHAAVLIKGGNVVAIGFNKNKSGMIAHEVYGERKWHSEVDCLTQMSSKDLKDAILYIAGVTESNNLLYSKPCSCCQEYLKDYNLKSIYFADRHGKAIKYA